MIRWLGIAAKATVVLTFLGLGVIVGLFLVANGHWIAVDVPPMLLAQNTFALYFMAVLAWLSRLTTLEGALDPLLRSSLALQLRGLAPRRG